MPETNNSNKMKENKIPDVSGTITWFERTSAFIKKTGLKDIIVTSMVIFMFIVIGYVAINPSKTIERYEKIIEKKHTESVMRRLNNEPKIREGLISLKSELNADRVYILETHNGGTNLAGLPFLYVDLTYAEPKTSLGWLENEYRNVRLSRYPWASALYENTSWNAPVEDLETLDPELYHRLKSEGVEYMAAIMMYGEHSPSGVIGIVYTDKSKVPQKTKINNVMTRYCSKLTILFNNK